MASFTRFKFYEVDINESLGLPDNVQCADQASSGGVALGCADGGLVLLQPDQSSKTSVPAHGGTVHALAWYEVRTILWEGSRGSRWVASLANCMGTCGSITIIRGPIVVTVHGAHTLHLPASHRTTPS